MGIMSVSSELFRQSLRLPEGTVIMGVVNDGEVFGQIKLIVSHPDLPVVKEGKQIVPVNPQFGTDGFEGWWPKPKE